MKLSMLRDLNSAVIIRELSPNTSSVSLIVRILFSEKMLSYDPEILPEKKEKKTNHSRI